MKPIVIKLIPTDFLLDVWICSKENKLAKAFHKRYGESVEYYRNETVINSVSTISTTAKSKLKGHTLFVMILENRDKAIIVHEIIHALWHISNTVHLEMNTESQEWQACMAEYIYTQITKTTT